LPPFSNAFFLGSPHGERLVTARQEFLYCKSGKILARVRAEYTWSIDINGVVADPGLLIAA
jgi:hypothetical protein